MERVDVFFRVDRVQNALFVDSLGKRKLDQNPVNRRVGVHLGDEREKFFGRRFGGKAAHYALHSGFNASGFLVADVNLTRRIFADENDGQTGLHLRFGDEARDVLFDFGANNFGQAFAVENLSGHNVP